MFDINELNVNLKNEYFKEYLLKYIKAVKCPDTNITEILIYESIIKSYCEKFNINFLKLLNHIFKDIPEKELYYNYIQSNFNVIEKKG